MILSVKIDLVCLAMNIGFTLSARRFYPWSLFAASFLLYSGMCKIIGNDTNMNLCNANDRQVLLQFRQGVDDGLGKALSSWSTEQDCCKWRGIYCNNVTGRVTKVELFNQLLGGYIDLSVLSLEFLNHLDLSFNNFSRIFPSHSTRNISNTKLIFLHLSSKNRIPIHDLKWISHLSALEYLGLDGHDLHESSNWLESLSSLPSLVELHLSGCQLGKTFPSMGFGDFINFTSLQVLDLSRNMFNGSIPSSIGTMSSLISLDLSWNMFHGSIPSSIGNLPSLISLDLESNCLNGSIPEILWQNPKLEILIVGNNSFTGVLSELNFSRLSNLKSLDLTYSSTLEFDVGSDWIPPFQLRQLDMSYCNLGPDLPEWLYTQRSIEYLNLSSSGLSFTADNKFWNLMTSIDFLDLSNNSIKGDMSKVLLASLFVKIDNNRFSGKLPRLSSKTQMFVAGGNSFSGPISHLLCDVASTKNSLLILELPNNLLSGELSDCWVNWQNLCDVNLGGNQITGSIPDSMGLLPNLTMLRLHNNRLHGNVPYSFRSCRTLRFLDLRKNILSGKVPTWLNPDIIVLILGSNQFDGDISSQICQLSGLQILDLSGNKLSGQVPKCLDNITAMSFVYSPPVCYLGFISELIDLIITPNWFSDAVKLMTKGQENEYGWNFQFLRYVDLSSNGLSGTLPPELFHLAAVAFLNISNNHLVGGIPREIGRMRNLESLDLSRNHLSGTIPECMSNLSFLDHLNLSYNNLSGCIPQGTQLQSFNSDSFKGNPHLSGFPLLPSCMRNDGTSPTNSTDGNGDEDDEFYPWFYCGLGVGFAISFCAVWSITICFR